MKHKILIIMTLLFSLSIVHAKTLIKVGAYDFPPFAEWHSGKPSGLMVPIIELLNSKQDKYNFQLVETSPNRRYEDLHNKIYDMIFFENIQWGWDKNQVEVSKVFMEGGEVFITKNDPAKNQLFFSSLKDKTIRGILGYHYQFANFSTDPLILKAWKIELTNSHEGNIIAVLDARSDLAIVTKEFLDIYLKKHPEYAKKILISKKMDQIYHHMVIVRRGVDISVKEVNSLLDNVKKDKSLQKLLVDF